MKKMMFLSLIVVLLLSACSKPPAASGVDAKAKAAAKKSADIKLEVVSVHWVGHASSTYNQVSWNDGAEERGLVVVLKKGAAADLTIHSSDYVLAFESDSSIPRRPCLGISYGMKTADEEISWAVIGSMGRYWNEPDQSYFALLFAAPISVSQFSILRADPLLTKIAAPVEPPNPAPR